MKLILFYGRGCPDCTKAMPWIKELNLDVEEYEVWHNEDNVKKREEYRDIIMKFCKDIDYVPCFVDVKNKRAICEPRSKEQLKEWIENKI